MGYRSDFIYCGCGAVFHAETGSGFANRHTASTGHTMLTSDESETYIQRRCTVCGSRPGTRAFGYRGFEGGEARYAWACDTCVARACGVPIRAQ